MALDLGATAQGWLSCAVTALGADAPERAFVQPGGSVAWDDCCSGQLWVRFLSIVPALALGTRKASGDPCGAAFLDVTAAVGVIRCVHTLDDEGNAPTAAELTADALVMTRDQAALLDAVNCCIRPSSILRWEPLGPQGGCAGGEWSFLVRLPGCTCP